MKCSVNHRFAFRPSLLGLFSCPVADCRRRGLFPHTIFLEIEDMKNAKGQAVSADAYQKFILYVVKEHDGIILEDMLDEILVDAYQPHWGPTDLEPWGRQSHPKWKQNVASAKSGLDRRGIVVRFKQTKAIPIDEAKPGWKVIKRKGQLYRLVTEVYRVLLPEQTYLRAYDQWRGRELPGQKLKYKKLKQPQRVFLVPK